MADAAELEAYIEISQVKARYCWMLDTKDWAGFADLFTEDFELDVTGSGGVVVKGREEAVKSVRGSIETARTAHQIHSPEIRLEGDVAHVVWAMQDRVVWAADQRPASGIASLTGYGHYHERYVRRNGRWRIAASRLTRLHMDIERGPA